MSRWPLRRVRRRLCAEFSMMSCTARNSSASGPFSGACAPTEPTSTDSPAEGCAQHLRFLATYSLLTRVSLSQGLLHLQLLLQRSLCRLACMHGFLPVLKGIERGGASC